MKVLLVNKFHYRKGGSETYYFTLAEALAAAGHTVIFFSMADPQNLPCPQAEYFVPNASVDGGLAGRVQMLRQMVYSRPAYRRMAALLQAEHPDLVLLNLVHKHLTLSILEAIRAYDPALPVFWTLHDLIPACPAYTMRDGQGKICEACLAGSFVPCVQNRCIRGSLPMSLLAYREATVIRRKGWYDLVDLYLCPSVFYRRLLTRAQFTHAPLVTLRNPLPLGTCYTLAGPEEGYFLYMGRLSAEKGVLTLLHAAIDTHCPLVVCGTGPQEDACRQLAAGQDHIQFRGFQTGEALRRIVQGCRCVVLPSEWYENGPYSAAEAMAQGKPLIVSDQGGLPELVEDGVNGFVYPMAEGAAALGQRLCAMRDLPADAYAAQCRSARDRARAWFDPRTYVQTLEALYTAIRRGESPTSLVTEEGGPLHG